MRTTFTAIGVAAALTVAPLGAAFNAHAVEAPSGAYTMDPTHASITWRVMHMGLSNYTARFTNFDINLNLDVENPANSNVSATIDPTSVRTDYPFADQKDFDAEIAGEDFLKAGSFPEITFTSTSIEMTGERTANITGDLTIAGVTREVVLDATLNGAMESHPFAKVPAVGFSATTTIDRTNFGVDFLPPAVVASEVNVLIEAEFTKTQ